MDAQRQFRGPNVLIVAGLIPLALWFCGFMWLMVTWHVRGAGYEAYLVAPTGLAAYLVTMAVSGGGCLWADRRVRSTEVSRPMLTRRLVQVVAAVLIAPWILLPAAVMIWGGK